MNADIAHTQKHRLRHVLYLAFAALVGAYAIYVFYWMAHLPHLGYCAFFEESGKYRVVTVTPGGPADKMGLRVGDQILQVGHSEIRNPIDALKLLYMSTVQTPFQLPFTFKRGPAVLTGQLTAASPVFPCATLFGLILGMIPLSLGLIVYLKKPLDPSARVFYLLNLCACTGTVTSGNFLSIYNPAGLISRILPAFAGPLSLHFLLISPEKKKSVDRHTSILTLIYIPILLLLAAGAILEFTAMQDYLKGQKAPSSYHYMTLMWETGVTIYLAYSIIGFSCLGHTFFTTRSSVVKMQIKWIFWGATISLILTFWGLYELRQDLPRYFSGGRTLPITLVFSMVIIWIVYFFAILKYRLMDIDIVIHRSLSYSVMSGIIIIFYFLFFWFLSWGFQFLTGKSTLATLAVSAILVAFILRPLLTQIQQAIDRLFYKEKHALNQAMGALSQALISVRNPPAIFQKVYHTVEKVFQICSGTLWLSNESDQALEPKLSFPDSANTPQFVIDRSHPLARHLTRTRKGLTRYQVETEAQFQYHRRLYLEPFQQTNTAIFPPLIYHDSLLGLIGFGEKRSGGIYASDDVFLLTTLVHQTAIAVENARAYDKTRRLNLSLEKKVKQIQQQQGEILALQKRLLNENTYLQEEIHQQFNFAEIIGDSPAMKNVLAMVEKAAPTPSTVLLRGESGTGKELIARAIHFNSARKKGPFVKVNCAAIPANLMESELFGHEKGAFTGALKSRIGKFELACGGSIFLDEIGDLSLELQVKFLRVLQEKEFERVGCRS